MKEIKSKNQQKYSWIDDLEADELRDALYDAVEEIDNLKKALILNDTKSSIALSKNTKGVNFDVKVYDLDVDKAKAQALKMFNDLKARFGE